jgi:predicted Fe-Mo cluster-binding NifX family protein
MKICIPTETNRLFESKVHSHFGTAPFFTFVDTDTQSLRSVPNPDCHGHHGACHHVQVLAAHDVEAVVCGGIGRRATAGLREAGIEVLAASAETVADIVAAVRDGRALPLSEHDICGGGHHRHGDSSECAQGHGRGSHTHSTNAEGRRGD